MNKLKITGASDDLIEIEGQFQEEFNHHGGDGERAYLSISDGTLLSIRYDEDGIWRLTRVIAGTAEFSKEEGDVAQDTNDVVTLKSETLFSYVLLGETLAKS